MRRLVAPRPATVDTETLPIEDRPDYPPPVVGVSVKRWGKPSRYYGFGHAEGNNSTWAEARAAVLEAYQAPGGVLFQNAKFDLEVIEAEWDLPAPAWDRVHDTMLLLFLDDPHQRELGLKPSAERLLAWPPEERDALEEWLLAHQPIRGTKLSKSKASDHYAGAYVAFAPGEVVGKYANGDVDRTEALFKHLHAKTLSRGMGDAYDRERRLLPILLRMERRGIAVDLPRLAADVQRYRGVRDQVDAWLRKKLKCPELNLDSGDQLADALVATGLADEDLFLVTKTGKRSTNKDSLMGAVTDRGLLGLLRYRAALKTTLGTFMEAWLRMATRTGGTIHTTWNQVKAPDHGDLAGTRTGRLSATWFMNMPKEFSPIFRHEATGEEAKKLPTCPIKGLPSLPLCRGYVIPFAGHVLLDRDYSQQEPRILGHFDGGDLMEKYQANPWIDFHDYAKAELEQFGLFYARKPVKNTNLGLIYGMGVGKLALKNDMTVAEAKTLKNAILKLYPGLKDMYSDMRVRMKHDEPIRTWGGREYYCEPPRMIEGRLVTFDYKMVNVLIQGSAADCTKEVIIRLSDAIADGGHQDEWFIILNVHDQLVMSTPIEHMSEAMELQRQIMEQIEFDVPMLSEGEYSFDNWGALKPYDTKGKQVYGH